VIQKGCLLSQLVCHLVANHTCVTLDFEDMDGLFRLPDVAYYVLQQPSVLVILVVLYKTIVACAADGVVGTCWSGCLWLSPSRCGSACSWQHGGSGWQGWWWRTAALGTAGWAW
jgi:hypothetical protein